MAKKPACSRDSNAAKNIRTGARGRLRGRVGRRNRARYLAQSPHQPESSSSGSASQKTTPSPAPSSDTSSSQPGANCQSNKTNQSGALEERPASKTTKSAIGRASSTSTIAPPPAPPAAAKTTKSALGRATSKASIRQAALPQTPPAPPPAKVLKSSIGRASSTATLASPQTPTPPSSTTKTSKSTIGRTTSTSTSAQTAPTPPPQPAGSKVAKSSIGRASSTTTIAQVSPSIPAGGKAAKSSTGRASSNVKPPQTAASQDPPQASKSAEKPHETENDYQLLLSPLFAAMTKITDHLFLTGVGGMNRENFRKNHIDFVVNITTEAPFWDDIESIRLPLDDDINTNILPYLDIAVDRIHEAIVRRNAHVLVHCVAGVSRSATIVIAYLMKIKRMDLKTAFNFCYNLRPVIRPNNGFMIQLINYEFSLFNKCSVVMVDVDVEGTLINVPNFFVDEHPKLILLEVMRVREQQKKAAKLLKSSSNKSNNKDRSSSHSDD